MSKNHKILTLLAALCVPFSMQAATTYGDASPSVQTGKDSAESRDDFKILGEVQDAIKRSYRNYNINIRIFDGIVTLTGVVNSEHEKQTVENKVRKVQGVKKVNNQITVGKLSSSSSNTDED